MIYLGADHRGFFLKEKIRSWLSIQGILYEDMGADVLNAEDDYPDYAEKVARQVAKKPGENFGILICGSGAGMCIAANKFRGIRAALALNPEMARSIRNDDDANILCIASDFTEEDEAIKIVDTFLHTRFGNEERYRRRISKISDIESRLWQPD
jgi:RpiB/LacA/LacB family sugar-phosphate isomerase